MAALTVTPITRAGIPGTLVAAAGGGDTFANTGKEFLEVVNGGGAPITVTIAVPYTVDGITLPGKTVSVTNGQRRLIGPFPSNIYNDPTLQTVGITYSAVTSVTVGVFQLVAAG